MAAVDPASQKGRPVCGTSVLQIGPSHMGRLAMIVTLSGANPLYCYTQSGIIHDLFFITPKYTRSGQLGLEDEDFDFGLFFENVVSNKERLGRMGQAGLAL